MEDIKILKLLQIFYYMIHFRKLHCFSRRCQKLIHTYLNLIHFNLFIKIFADIKNNNNISMHLILLQLIFLFSMKMVDVALQSNIRQKNNKLSINNSNIFLHISLHMYKNKKNNR